MSLETALNVMPESNIEVRWQFRTTESCFRNSREFKAEK